MPSEFYIPPWDAPLDVNAELDAIPKGATIKGLFILPMIVEGRRRGITLPRARERYLPFTDYPLEEQARLLVDAAHAFYPELSTRRGLRRLGRAAHQAFAQATIGKVMWASVDSVDAALEAAAKTYAVTASSTRVTILECAADRAHVRLEGAHCFLDSNHVGTFEGVLLACNTKASVSVRIDSPTAGELLLTGASPSARGSRAP